MAVHKYQNAVFDYDFPADLANAGRLDAEIAFDEFRPGVSSHLRTDADTGRSQARNQIAPPQFRQSSVTTARYELHSPEPVPVTESLRICERLRQGLMAFSRGTLPPELSGHDLPESNLHGHAFWLAEDADGDGLIDHLFVHAPAGLSRPSVKLLTALKYFRFTHQIQIELMLCGIGPSHLFEAASTLTRRHNTWESVTPYLHPWHLKRAQMRTQESIQHAIEQQVRREWAKRSGVLPPILSIESVEALHLPSGQTPLYPQDFHRFREKGHLIQPDKRGRFLRLNFAAPVCGPIALGFGCHFGLGLFSAPRP